MKKGFIFIETIIVICVLTIALMSLYSNYSKILTNTRELNTFDTAEYNYKTYFLKKQNYSIDDNICTTKTSIPFSEDSSKTVKICKFSNITNNNAREIREYIDLYKGNMDAYIIDYLLSQDLNGKNDNLFLVEYKKLDKVNSTATNKVYLTYISSLNY